MCRILVLVLMFCISGSLYSAQDKVELLSDLAKDNARCLDVVVGNFESDDDSTKVTKAIYRNLINIMNQMIDIELQNKNREVMASIEVMGRDVLVGYMLKSITIMDKAYQDEKSSLMNTAGYDWRLVHKEMWKKHGCTSLLSHLNW